jgi:hypothetical protein
MSITSIDNSKQTKLYKGEGTGDEPVPFVYDLQMLPLCQLFLKSYNNIFEMVYRFDL